MGRHSLVKERRNPSVLLASVLAAAAVFLVVKADASPVAEATDVEPVAQQAPAGVDAPTVPCCVEIVASPATAPEADRTIVQASANSSSVSLVSASRWRVVSPTLPAGVAPERGLQVRTILTARSISAVFPEIHQIGGVRQDALRWHPNGLALDVMIPNPSSEAGIALGNAIVAYVLQNAKRFGMQDAIWRGMYYTPSGAHASSLGHYDHVHVTTTGGGYPSGDEQYFR